MDINKLPSDIQYYIMSYLDDSPIVYKKLHSDKIEKYTTIYHDMMDQSSKAYVISGSCSYTRNKEIDHQIHQFSKQSYSILGNLLQTNILFAFHYLIQRIPCHP